MTANGKVVALTEANRSLVLRLPVDIGSAMVARGYNRAEVVVTGEGILLRPFVASLERGPVDLPEWGS